MACCSVGEESTTTCGTGDRPDELRVFYLQTLPMSLLSGKRIRDVQERADGVRVVYDEDSAVTVCPADGTFEVVCGGRTVARDGGVFAPGIRPGVYLAYACRVGRYVWELPAQWDPARRCAPCP